MKKINRLDFNKYKQRLEILLPQYSEKERKDFFDLRVDFWEIIIENSESEKYK